MFLRAWYLGLLWVAPPSRRSHRWDWRILRQCHLPSPEPSTVPFSHRSWVSGERFPKDSEIILVDDRGAGIHPGRDGRGRSGSPVFEFVDRIVVQIVEEFEAVVAHHVRFLHHRRGDGAALDPVQCFRVLVEGHDWNLSRQIYTVERIGHAPASRSLEEKDPVRLVVALD